MPISSNSIRQTRDRFKGSAAAGDITREEANALWDAIASIVKDREDSVRQLQMGRRIP